MGLLLLVGLLICLFVGSLVGCLALWFSSLVISVAWLAVGEPPKKCSRSELFVVETGGTVLPLNAFCLPSKDYD